jgi:cyclohexyl-isocyanide hydratase
MTQPRLSIVFVLYPGVTQLDFTGPYQFLSRLPGSATVVASVDGGDMQADGLTFSGLTKLSDIEQCDVICVPGGFGTTEAMGDQVLLAHLRRLAVGARYVTSVCTGSLLLAAAGLLQGKRAACHWAWREQLGVMGAIPDDGRVVRDGNVMTGGGVTAGIDFALTLVAEIAGEDFAKGLQLGLEYAPAPPFNSGRPETAEPEVYERVEQLYALRRDGTAAAARAAAERLKLAQT